MTNGLGNFLRAPEGANSAFGGFEAGDDVVNTAIDALAEEGLVNVLAEPNLTALSGETASFLAGGEFPIPIDSDDDGLEIEFKEFGISLAFTPTVLSADRISLRVRPEVSDLTDKGAINLNGLVIPALATRRAETTVELGSGQSLRDRRPDVDRHRERAVEVSRSRRSAGARHAVPLAPLPDATRPSW